MAKLLTPEEIGQKILEIYKSNDIRPGEMLQIQNINFWALKADIRGEDLITGLQWLDEKGYIEQRDDRSKEAIFLTEAGFEAM